MSHFVDLTMAAINDHVRAFDDTNVRTRHLLGLQGLLRQIRTLPETTDCPEHEQIKR